MTDPLLQGPSQVTTKEELELERLRLRITALQARLRYDEENRDKERRDALDASPQRKVTLESEKLEEEVAELRTRNRFVWLPSTISIVTILAGLITAWLTVSSYFDQQERNGELQLTEPLIKVAQLLGSDKEFERETATLLLSALERNAVSVLILVLAKHPDESPYAIEALSLIEHNPHVCAEEDVVRPLLDGASLEFTSAPLDDPARAHAVLSFTEAVGRLARPTEWSSRCFRWPWQPRGADRALAELRSLRRRIEDAQAQGKLDPAGHFAMGRAIDEAYKRLSR